MLFVAAMGTPPTDELVKKIQQLEEGHAHLKQEMSKLKLSDVRHGHHRQRSHSVSPQRSRLGAPPKKRSDAPAAWKRGSCSFKQSSPLQRESRGGGDPQIHGGGGEEAAPRRGPSAVNFTERQYLNILQSMGQSVHILDLNCRIIYWSAISFSASHFFYYFVLLLISIFFFLFCNEDNLMKMPNI